jgi:hypothetical protein
MKKLLVYGTAAGALCASGASLAASFYPPGGSLALYGSYMAQDNSAAGLSPDGGGGGVQLGVNLTPNFFVSGMYQYDYLYQSNAPASSFGLGSGTITYGDKIDQGRAGGGVVFHLPVAPLDVFGKVEYVHYDYQAVNTVVNDVPEGSFDRVNNDGVGVHAGLQSKLPGVSVYGSVGYLNLSKSNGGEFNVGAMVPLAPFTWAFVEYRYDNLANIGAPTRTETNNVKAGVRLAF